MQNTPDTIRTAVREHYAERALTSTSCCGPDDECACSDSLYNVELLTDLPADVAQFSLGCGDPISLARLQPGEIVVDLGSGGGLDCFLAARQVGPQGRAIGVDMTPEMLERARAAALRLKVDNVEFRQGYLEALPLEDNSADVVISNCVINLSPDKPQVFREIYRALKPGGRLAVSDIVTTGALPEAVQTSLEAWGACVAGALAQADYERGLAEAGFVDVLIERRDGADPSLDEFAAGLLFSAAITARKGGM
jgi:SAM-dependent methyltransferase